MDNCTILSPQVCASTCLPTSQQTDFSCVDWWTIQHCCNGTQPVKKFEAFYYDCTCVGTCPPPFIYAPLIYPSF